MKVDPTLRDIPVIMISAVTEINSVIHCIELGADDYLPKPFNPTLLRARIGASLKKKRLLDDLNKLNQQLEHRVADQVGEIERMSRLRRFLPPQVADLIVASGTEK